MSNKNKKEVLTSAEGESHSASENGSMTPVKKGAGAAYYIRIAGVLTLICSVVALMLAVVNMITKDKIAENIESKQTDAIRVIFGDDIDSAIEYDNGDDNLIYIVEKNKEIIGYCVMAYPKGYGGEMGVIVGINPDKTLKKAQIIYMSETSGVGSKTKSDPNFLSQFEGKSGSFKVGDNIIPIAGATISSKAVTEGINTAMSVELNLAEAAHKLGLKFSAEEETSAEESEETTSETAESENEKAPETDPVSEPETADPYATNVDPTYVGGYPVRDNDPSDNAYIAERDTGYFLEHETTDTEETSDTESEADPTDDSASDPAET